jgi:hypothetical protein
MVEYSLAKAEVEGSSPFFRLGFVYPVFSSKNLFFLLPNIIGANMASAGWQIIIICHDSGRREGTLWVLSTQ